MTTAHELALVHFTLERDRQQIAWLDINMADSTVNRLSSSVLQELTLVLDHLATQPPAGLVIHSSKHTGFIAGADVDEFTGLDSTEHALALVARGWKLFERLASVSYPTLALIHGHCLGGGLELALACRYRLAVDRDDTRLALPEVRLGIFPGWGGMMRLPRLIGAIAALDLMLSGKAVNARRAAALGLVDAAVPQRLALQAAARHVISGAPPRTLKGVKALLNHPWARPLIARQTHKTLDKRDPYHHYPAPRAILTMWMQHDGNPLKAPEQIEQLTQSAAAHNLLRVFRLQERLKHLGSRNDAPAHILHIHVVGAGTMGGDIAAWCALKGLRVTVQDQNRQQIALAQARAARLFKRRLKEPRLVQAALDRLIPDTQGAGVRHADLVLEAITENADAKRSLYASLEPLLKPDAILATNTSSLSLSDLNRDLQQPDRLIGIHFFNPVAHMPLIEVVETATLNATVRQNTYAFVHQIDKLPLPVQSSPGFLVNAVLAPYMLEAMRCVDEGIIPAAIDQAMLEFGMPMGPIELADTVGLDIVHDAGVQLSNNAKLPICLNTRLQQNHLGKKTGQGFYTWTKGKPQKPDSPPSLDGLVQRLLEPLLTAVQERVDDGIVADADLADAGIIFGAGFAPFLGGPLHYRDTRTASAD